MARHSKQVSEASEVVAPVVLDVAPFVPVVAPEVSEIVLDVAPYYAPQEVEKIQVRTVFGPMLDPFSNVKYEQHWEDVDVPAPGSWLDCQIAAGKMEKRG